MHEVMPSMCVKDRLVTALEQHVDRQSLQDLLLENALDSLCASAQPGHNLSTPLTDLTTAKYACVAAVASEVGDESAELAGNMAVLKELGCAHTLPEPWQHVVNNADHRNHTSECLHCCCLSGGVLLSPMLALP